MRYIYRFKEANHEDEDHIGKNAVTLCQMSLNDIPLPPGFIISSFAYDAFFRENNLTTKIEHLLATVDQNRPESLIQVATHIKKIIHDTPLPEQLVGEILSAYHKLSPPLSDAVVTLEVSESENWQHTHPHDPNGTRIAETKGETNLIFKLKDIWSSHFSAPSLQFHQEHFQNRLPHGCAVIVKEVIQAETSGILLTADPVNGDKSSIHIEAIFGSVALLKNGHIIPDRYLIQKDSLNILSLTQSPQTVLLKKTGLDTKEVLLSAKDGRKQKISAEKIQKLALISKKIEELFITPQVVEWVYNGNELSVIQTQTLPPPTVSKRNAEKGEHGFKEPLIASGIPSSKGVITGPGRIITSLMDAKRIEKGDIVVLASYDSSFRPFLKKAGGLIVEHAGSMSLPAFFARELGIPSVMGVKNATKLFRTGTVVRVDGGKGLLLKPQSRGSAAADHQLAFTPTASKVFVNLSDKKLLTDTVISRTDGLGLLPSEAIIRKIGIHPKKMIRDGKSLEFINQLAEEVAVYCRSFSPLPVIYRTSDLTTKEYRSLVGGKEFEPQEENPLLGFRGAYRYIHDPEMFLLEIEAIKTIRNKMNLRNIWLMIPFVRTVKELTEVKRLISASGLYRSPSFRVWMMVELPSNVLLIDAFIQAGIDGIMIDSDDLAKTILGTDYENSEVTREITTGNDAVLQATEHVIKTASKHTVDSILHFPTPLIHQDFLENSIRWGGSGVSVPHQAIDATRSIIAKVEKNLIS